jgi:hypothetical protein
LAFQAEWAVVKVQFLSEGSVPTNLAGIEPGVTIRKSEIESRRRFVSHTRNLVEKLALDPEANAIEVERGDGLLAVRVNLHQGYGWVDGRNRQFTWSQSAGDEVRVRRRRGRPIFDYGVEINTFEVAVCVASLTAQELIPIIQLLANGGDTETASKVEYRVDRIIENLARLSQGHPDAVSKERHEELALRNSLQLLTAKVFSTGHPLSEK